jgi:hypothetical protein
LKKNLLLVLKTMVLFWDTKSKRQYDSAVLRPETSHIEYDLILVLKNRHLTVKCCYLSD